MPLAHADLDDIRFRISADATFDDNLTRAQGDDKLYDTFTTVSVGATLPLDLSRHTRLMLSTSAGADRFVRYETLNRSFGDLQGELQYRGSGRFGEPIWGLFTRIGADRYQSELRDGYRSSSGVSIRKPVTDRIFVFGALTYNVRDGRSKVFDTKEVSLRTHLDYSLSNRHTVYLGIEGRRGGTVSVARSNLAFLDIADALVEDDAFIDTPRLAYRFKASTGIVTIGYNLGLGERTSLDFTLRGAYSRPDEQPPEGVAIDTVQYTSRQALVSLLVRF